MPPAPRTDGAGTDPGPALPTDPDDPRIEVRRSRRRTRTVSARVEGEAVVVLMPAGLPRAEERRLIAEMLGKLARSGRRRGRRSSDAELMRRSMALSGRWLGDRARPASVRWVPAMTTRWASCTPSTREIRVSETLRDVPAYVLDYVLVHELAHLVVPGGHPPEFWEVVRGYPRTERAMGYLEALSRASGLSPGRGTGASGGGPGVGDDGVGDNRAGDDRAGDEGVGDLIGDDDEGGPL